jgi:hypothetical protein
MIKKYFSISFILLVFSILTSFANPVKKEKAITIAKIWFRFHLNKSNTEVLSIFEFRKTEVLVYYIVSFETGYVIVSADDSTYPILAYSNTHSYSEKGDYPPGHYALLSDYAEQIEFAIKMKFDNTKTKPIWDTIFSNKFRSKDVLDPLIKTKWGQSLSNDHEHNAFNFYCPHNDDCSTVDSCAAGCVAVAMAQIMRYWAYPGGAYNFYEWCNMPDSLLRFNASHFERPEYENERNTIAQLISDCGKAVDMDYCSKLGKGNAGCESMAWVNDECWALKTVFDYCDEANVKKRYWNSSHWEQMLKDDLNSGYPILYSALTSGKTEDKGGHTFIVDGYNGDQFHINWGWRGNNDDWYSLYYLSPNGNYNFNLAHRAIFNLYPKNLNYCEEIENLCDNDTYTSWTTIVSGTVFSKDINECPQFGGSIWPPLEVAYLAYNSVHLRQGFRVRSGAHFTAKRLGCQSDCRHYQAKKGFIKQNLSSEDIQIIESEIKNVSVFPNPVSDELNIMFPADFDSGIKEVYIMDLLGNVDYQQVYHTQRDETITINISTLLNGLYFLKLVSNNKITLVKFVKQ